MSFFRRRRNPLDPDAFGSAHAWLEALLATGMSTAEIRWRLREEVARQHRLQEQAEQRGRDYDFAQRTTEGRAAAADRLLREVGLEGTPDLPSRPVRLISDDIREGRFPWAW